MRAILFDLTVFGIFVGAWILCRVSSRNCWRRCMLLTRRRKTFERVAPLKFVVIERHASRDSVKLIGAAVAEMLDVTDAVDDV